MTDSTKSEMESMIRSSIRNIMEDYDETYWREIREENRFPQEFWNDLADGGWLGVTIPEKFGGQGLGFQEMVSVIEEIGINGGWPACMYFVLTPIFGGETLVKHGNQEQKEKWLPKIASGDAHWALGVTEPDTGLNTTNTSTTARKEGDEYIINGQKMWTSGAAKADRITLLARTIPIEEVDRASHGLSVFLLDPKKEGVEYDQIPLDGYFPDKTYNLYLDDVRVPESTLLGTEHEGLSQIFDTLNTERIAVAATGYATGRYALKKASQYANDRVVFDTPIGSHQAIQHPLADAYADLETTKLMIQKAARLYDSGAKAGTESNIAKLQAGKAAFNACEATMSTYGGMSISKEMGIASMWAFIRHLRIAPVSEEMLRNYIAEKELNLPRSY